MVPPAEAAWLELDPDPVLALLHRPELARDQGTAVLLCPPFGWEEMCSYRGRRIWAEELAAAGYPCARITLPGTGDSAGSPRDPGRLEAWTGAVAGAARWLREESGAHRLVALGISLGGMLACLAADQGAPIDDFILWGVPARGRALLRELRTYARVVGATYPEDTPESAAVDGDLQLIGFLMTGETARAIEAVELRAPATGADARRRALLLARDGLPVDQRLRQRFEQEGVEVTVEEGPGYGALMDHPQKATAPAKTIGRTIEWLSAASEERAAQVTGAPAPAPWVQRAARVAQSGETSVEETTLSFTGELAGSFAVLADTPERRGAGLCAVFVNGGALHHIGPNRTGVEVARRWAARGVPTVRVDVRGIGESDGDERRPMTDPSLYLAERTQETLAIVDQLAERGLGDRFILGGLCSGAYWSLHAALADRRVAATMLINLYAFFWSAELVAERETERALGALQGRAWRQLVRGQLTGTRIREGLGSLSPARLRLGAGHPVQRAQTARIEQALDQLRDQGTEALLLFSRGEGLYDQLERQGALSAHNRWPNLTVEQLPTRDHMFRAVWLQRHVHQSLDAALERVLSSAATRS
jgi:alpha-beta hydrolase superfamily lysophospholipase